MSVGKGYNLLETLLGFLACVDGFRIKCDVKSGHSTTPDVYNHEAINIYENETIPLSRFSGDLMLIVNVATF
jgi:hypothetical protein